MSLSRTLTCLSYSKLGRTPAAWTTSPRQHANKKQQKQQTPSLTYNTASSLSSVFVRRFSSPHHYPRPLSPHITIYAFPTTALLSGGHRISGTLMTIGCSIIALTAVAGDCQVQNYVTAFQLSFPILVPLAKFSVAFPLSYHYFSGLRFLFWEKTSRGLDLETVSKTGYGILGGSALLALIASFITV